MGNVMRFIVSIGWSIYPLGYFFGYLLGAVDDAPLNLIYNVADFVNKIWFCLPSGKQQGRKLWRPKARAIVGMRMDFILPLPSRFSDLGTPCSNFAFMHV